MSYKNSKFYKQENLTSSNENDSENKREYFNSVIGTIMKCGIEEKDMYELDEDDLREQQEGQIDQYTDVSFEDKKFFKIWNNFIKDKDICQIYMKGYLEEFLDKNCELIIKCNLKENLIIHLICLFDYGQINKCSFIELFDKVLEKEKQMNVDKK